MRFSDLAYFVDLRCFSACDFYEDFLDQLNTDSLFDALKRIELLDGKAAREDAFSRLMIAAEQAVQNGWIKSASALLPKSLELMSDVTYLISRFERSERAAILFAFSEGMDLDDVVMMRRKDLEGLNLAPATNQIIDRLTPHFRSDWLFWRDTNGIAMPLSNLPGRWAEKMPMSWSMFNRTFRQRWEKTQSDPREQIA